jgi:uncharacterized protein YecT (DUF1311 family)
MLSRSASRMQRSPAPSWPAGARCRGLRSWMGCIRSGMTSRHQGSVRPSTGHLERPPFPWRCSSASKEPTHAGTDGIEVHVVIRICVVSAVALMAALPAGAEMFGPGFQPCGEKTSTPAVVECVQAKTNAVDQRLNAAYKALEARIEANQRQSLLSAQRLWVQYRDANCGFYGVQDSRSGRSRQPNAYAR